MNKIVFSFILSSIFFSTCLTAQLQDMNKEISQVSKKFSKLVKKEKGLDLKSCVWEKESRQFKLELFAPPYMAGVNSAREPLYFTAKGFLNLLNSHKKLKTAFGQNFSIDDLEIRFIFYFPTPSKTSSFLSEAKFINKKFKYFINPKEGIIKEIKEESYEEALAIINKPRLPELNEQLANKISFETAKKVKKEKNIGLDGIGGSWLEDRDKHLTIWFSTYTLAKIEQAREMIVFCVEDFLNRLNASEEMKASLGHSFGLENIEIIIIFKEERGFDLDIHVRHVEISKGNKLGYITYQTDFSPYETMHEETYEEALEILRQAKPSHFL